MSLMMINAFLFISNFHIIYERLCSYVLALKLNPSGYDVCKSIFFLQ